MLEIVIERWTRFDGSVEFPWSVWRDGRRVQMGDVHADPEAAEAAAREFCLRVLGRAADRVRRL